MAEWRFATDEHVDDDVAKGLRLRGINAISAVDAGLLGQPEEAYIALGWRVGRVVYTQDDDFLKPPNAGEPHLGIVYSERDTQSIGEIIEFLEIMAGAMDTSEMVNRIQFF